MGTTVTVASCKKWGIRLPNGSATSAGINGSQYWPKESRLKESAETPGASAQNCKYASAPLPFLPLAALPVLYSPTVRYGPRSGGGRPAVRPLTVRKLGEGCVTVTGCISVLL